MKIPSRNGSKCVFRIYIYFVCYRSEYEHPLVVGNVKRKAKTMGIEIKTVNDWQQFLED